MQGPRCLFVMILMHNNLELPVLQVLRILLPAIVLHVRVLAVVFVLLS